VTDEAAQRALLAHVVSDLVAALREYDELVFDEILSHDLGVPATQGQIEALERNLGISLPPSYRVFLELHNGWSDFAGGAKLLSCEDHGSQWVSARIDEWADLTDDDANPFAHGAIPVLLGLDESSFLVIDPREKREQREMDLVMYDYMQEERRFPDFLSFLQYRLMILRALINRERNGIADVDDFSDDEG
jgi:hypothetical protein